MFREMRRNDRQISTLETIAALNEGVYGVLSTVGADGYPYGVPVNYVYHNGCIYFHCATTGQKLDNISNNSQVSFCVVTADRVVPLGFSSRFKSVILFGKAKEVFGDEVVEAIGAIVNKLGKGKYDTAGSRYIKAKKQNARVFKIEIEHMTGKANPFAACKTACPAGVNVPGYIALIKAGREKDAYNLIRQDNPFPAVCGRICVHLCETKCVRNTFDQPVAIRQLKRYAADCNLIDAGADNDAAVAPNGKKVAIIGAGPSGLTCGYHLSRLGYAVEIFEAQSVAGGVMAFGIPEYRLPKNVLQQEIELIKRAGVKIHLNTKIEENIEDLKKKFDAVYVAVGSQFSKNLVYRAKNCREFIMA